MNGLEKIRGSAPEYNSKMLTTLKFFSMLCLLAISNAACESDEKGRLSGVTPETTASALSSHPAVLDSGEKQAMIIDILERFVPHAESFRRASDLVEPLQNDPLFANVNLKDVLKSELYIGRAPEQVDEFVQDVVGPIRRQYRKYAPDDSIELKV